MTKYNVSETALAKGAQRDLENRLSVGRDVQARLVQSVASLHIKDKLVPPNKMFFHVARDGKVHLAYSEDADAGDRFEVHQHALGQMCAVSGFRKNYANFLMDDTRREKGWSDWAPKLFKENIETLFRSREYLDRQGQPTKFLHRLAHKNGQYQLRGFMSRNFGRHLASLPLLRGFIVACSDVGAEPLEASTSDIFFSLRCFIPYVFEPIPGELVSFGVSWSNSDFGAGRMKVSLCVMRSRGGKPIVLEDSLSRTHLGSIIQDSDLEVSEETATKEVAALVSAINDTVKKQLSPESIERLCDVIVKAHEQEISWAKLKSLVGTILGKGDFEELGKLALRDDSIVDLPSISYNDVGEAVPNRWWAANAISHLGEKSGSSDRAEELKELAGKVLNA